MSTVEERWRDLTAAALLGVERQPPPLEPTGTELDWLLGRLCGADPAAALLDAAAALALYRRAGQRPRRLEAADEAPPAAPDERPTCSPGATAHLVLMLGGQHEAVLGEWASALAAAGRRVPARLLPDLLERGRTHRDLRDAIVPLLGRRGRWLAAENPAWSYVLGEAVEPDETWTTGDRETRLALLRRWRAVEPDRARALLASTWAEEGPDDRATYLGALLIGLGPADESFLEAALDDRRREVRDLAADLLARRPDSALVGRMLGRVGPLLAAERGRRLLGLGAARLRLGVALPAACDRAMLRDGVSARRPVGSSDQIGDRASWLAQMLAAIPPATWSRQWAAAPGEIVAAAVESEHRAALLHGWRRAAVRHRDVDWAEALLAVPGRPDATAELVALLPSARREALVLEQLRGNRGPLVGSHPALLLLRQHHDPWSVELGRAVLDRVREAAAAADIRYADDWQLRGALVGFGRHMSPALLTEASAGWPVDRPAWSAWRETVEAFLAVLQFRRDMLEEIAR